LSDARYYRYTIFYDGVSYASEPAPVGVVRRTINIGNLTGEGQSATIKQVAAGPELKFSRMFEGGSEIREVIDQPGHVSGANTATLNLTDLRPEDEGWYICYVWRAADGLELEGVRHYVTVEPIPVIEDIKLPEHVMVLRMLTILPQSRALVAEVSGARAAAGHELQLTHWCDHGHPKQSWNLSCAGTGRELRWGQQVEDDDDHRRTLASSTGRNLST
jgi:hypothetical protein